MSNLALRKEHRQKFYNWTKQNGWKLYDRLSDVMENPEVDFKTGDEVMFTNDYGITFGPYTILGFAFHPYLKYNRYIYMDWDCYWFPCRPDQLMKLQGDDDFQTQE